MQRVKIFSCSIIVIQELNIKFNTNKGFFSLTSSPNVILGKMCVVRGISLINNKK